jgi:hypothetical protein
MTGGLAGMMIGVMMIAATMIGVMMTVVTMTAVMMIVVIEKPGDGGFTEFSGSLTGDTAQFRFASSAMVSKIDRSLSTLLPMFSIAFTYIRHCNPPQM